MTPDRESALYRDGKYVGMLRNVALKFSQRNT
jgi:hypothetical protein